VPEQALSEFAYAIVRVVPRVDRGERFNAGVVLYCRERKFLAARVSLDEQRLAALSDELAPETVQAHLDGIVRLARGDADAGPIAALPQAERFGWLVAPSSTVVQTSEVHTGLADDPAQALEELFSELVR
jgi:hypothetical protein